MESQYIYKIATSARNCRVHCTRSDMALGSLTVKSNVTAAAWKDKVTRTANKCCLDYETVLTNADEKLTVTVTSVY